MTNRSKGIVLSYFTVIIKNFSVLIYTQILISFFGKGDYGLYQLSNSIVSNLSLLNLGFSFAYIKFYTSFSVKKDQDGIKKLNGTYLIFFSGISLLTCVIGTIIMQNSSSFLSTSSFADEMKLKQLMFFMIINVVLTFISTTFESNILANERFVFQQIRQMLQSILLPVLTIPIIYFFHKNLVIVVIIQTAITILNLFVNVYFCIKKINMGFSFRNIELSFMKDIGTFSFFIFLNQIFNQINDSAPIYTLGILENTQQVAMYSIVNQLKSLFLTFSQVLTTIFIPKVNQLVHQSNSDSELDNLMIKIGRYQVLILGFFLGGFIVLGKEFLRFWLGQGFDNVYYLLISVVIPLLIPLSQNIAIEIQQARNKHFFRSIVLTIFSLLNIVITIISVNTVGVMGVTVGYIFSLIVGYGLVMNWYYIRVMKLNIKLFWKKTIPCLLPITMSTIICKVMTNAFNSNNLLNFFIIGLIYCVIYLIFIVIFIPHVLQPIIKVVKGKSK